VAAANGSSGRRLFENACEGGAAALGVQSGIAEGLAAHLVSLTPRHPINFEGDRLLDSWIFGNGADVGSVWVAGNKLVKDGRHIRRDVIAQRFRKAMTELLGSFAG
jgi:cytosine/adenosine deaminase-related metal-dependent hydrolase